MSIFSIGAILVGLSALFGYINHRFFHLPHTIGLVVIALLASLSIIGLDLALILKEGLSILKLLGKDKINPEKIYNKLISIIN